MKDQRWYDDPVYIDYQVTDVRDEGGYSVYDLTDSVGTLQTGWLRTDVAPVVGDVMRVFNRSWGMAVRGKVLFRHDDNWSAVVDWYVGQEDPDVANGDPRAGEEARAWWRKRRIELGQPECQPPILQCRHYTSETKTHAALIYCYLYHIFRLCALGCLTCAEFLV